MNEIDRFKKTFFMGRLLWAVGSKGEHRLLRVKRLLKRCQIKSTEILVLKPPQFIDMLTSGLSGECIERYEVLVLHDFEQIEAHLVPLFLKCIQTFRELQMGLSMRLVLVSERLVTPELDNFSKFKPTQIAVEELGDDPGDLNARVHLLLEQAIVSSRIPVLRISERAAVFLEYYSRSASDHDILDLVILGLCRSDHRVLRFRDFLPNFKYPPDEGSAAEQSNF